VLVADEVETGTIVVSGATVVVMSRLLLVVVS
jgi:hypothetical protein